MVACLYTLIIADDELEIREGMAQLIDWAALGYQCVGTASNGNEALQLIETLHPDVALCDIRMPGLTGLDVAQRLHAVNSPTIPVLLSAYRDFEYARTAMAYNVRYYIIKSARYSEIIETFRRIHAEISIRRQEIPGEDALIMDLSAWITRHLDSATLDSAAQRFNRSPSSLSRYFHQKTGEMFSHYLLRKRMERASDLLMDGSIRISDVSRRTGYTSPQNFARSFRQYYGVTPREYRVRRGIIPGEDEDA